MRVKKNFAFFLRIFQIWSYLQMTSTSRSCPLTTRNCSHHQKALTAPALTPCDNMIFMTYLCTASQFVLHETRFGAKQSLVVSFCATQGQAARSLSLAERLTISRATLLRTYIYVFYPTLKPLAHILIQKSCYYSPKIMRITCLLY